MKIRCLGCWKKNKFKRSRKKQRRQRCKRCKKKLGPEYFGARLWGANIVGRKADDIDWGSSKKKALKNKTASGSVYNPWNDTKWDPVDE